MFIRPVLLDKDMTTRRKWMIAVAVTMGAALVSPIIFTVLSAKGNGGYFVGGRCACGNDIFIRVEGDGYFKYSPGHGVPERRSFTVHWHNSEGDVMGLPHSDMYWSPLEGENKVIGRLRFHEGALFESWGSSTNWTRLPRVYNPYRIWIAKLLDK